MARENSSVFLGVVTRVCLCVCGTCTVLPDVDWWSHKFMIAHFDKDPAQDMEELTQLNNEDLAKQVRRHTHTHTHTHTQSYTQALHGRSTQLVARVMRRTCKLTYARYSPPTTHTHTHTQ